MIHRCEKARKVEGGSEMARSRNNRLIDGLLLVFLCLTILSLGGPRSDHELVSGPTSTPRPAYFSLGRLRPYRPAWTTAQVGFLPSKREKEGKARHLGLYHSLPPSRLLLGIRRNRLTSGEPSPPCRRSPCLSGPCGSHAQAFARRASVAEAHALERKFDRAQGIFEFPGRSSPSESVAVRVMREPWSRPSPGCIGGDAGV